MTTDERINKLARLAETRGYITYHEVNDIFPDHQFCPDDLDEIRVELFKRNIELIDTYENPGRD